jgi:tetrahydromethanopterin:alpha-L-glutamate ligase
MEPPEVLILGGQPEGWHGARLREAFARLGARIVRRDFRTLGLTLGEGATGIAGLSALPAAALVRSIPAGGFEEVTLRLGLLHALEAMGVPVVNGPQAIERCVDKSMTGFLLARAGLPTPPAWTVERLQEAAAIVEAEAALGNRLVAKPLFGAQGKGLRLVARPEDLPEEAEAAAVWHLQRYVGREHGWQDHRVLVIGGRAVAAMERHGTNWITNVRQGGMPRATAARGPLARLAVAAAAAVGAFYAGVDLIETDAGPTVLEVNSMPAWRGLQSVCDVDIAVELARAVVAAVRAEA